MLLKSFVFALITPLVFAGVPDLIIEKTYVPEDCAVKSQNGDTLSMHYTGTLASDGSKFDSSLDRNSPLEFQIGAGRVIQGWEKGLLDMCIGEKRKLTIPFSMAYGDVGYPPVIPANSDLVFTTELVNIKGHKKTEL